MEKYSIFSPRWPSIHHIYIVTKSLTHMTRMTVSDSTFICMHAHKRMDIHIHIHTPIEWVRETCMNEPIDENSGLSIAHWVRKRKKDRKEKKRRNDRSRVDERKKISAQVAWSSQFWLKHWSVNTLFTFCYRLITIRHHTQTKQNINRRIKRSLFNCIEWIKSSSFQFVL